MITLLVGINCHSHTLNLMYMLAAGVRGFGILMSICYLPR